MAHQNKANTEEGNMPKLSTDQLKEQIAIVPIELRKALEQQAKARMTVASLQSQIDKIEAEIEKVSEEDEYGDEIEGDDLEEDLALIKMESAIERLKLKLQEEEDKAEIAFRRSTEKTTEALVKAAVGTNPKVIELRSALLDAKEALKEKRLTLQNERIKAREAELEARYSAPAQVIPEDDKLVELREKFASAEYDLSLADIEVEVVRAKIETYKMLVGLEQNSA